MVVVLDRKDLSIRISKELPFSEATDFTVAGSKLIGQVLLVFQSAVRLERQSYSDAAYQYELPYVASSSYDIHLLNQADGSVMSFSGINSNTLGGVRQSVAGCKEAVLLEARLRLPSIHASKDKAVNKCIYNLDQFFLVDQGRLLIFALSNLENNKLYYSLDLRHAESAPQLRLPSELATKYPDELVATERPPKNPFEDRVLTVSDKQYRVERAAILAGGMVILGQENILSDSRDLDPLYSDHRTVVGIRPTAPDADSFDRVWQYKLNYDEAVDAHRKS